MPKTKPLPLQLVLPKKKLSAFKKKCLRTPNEVLAVMVGTVVKENDRITRVVVEDLVYPAVAAEPGWVEWNPAAIARLAIAVAPRAVIGSLHSHPNVEYPGLSREDVETSASAEEILFGVFTYWGEGRRKTSLDFYMGAKTVSFEEV